MVSWREMSLRGKCKNVLKKNSINLNIQWGECLNTLEFHFMEYHEIQCFTVWTEYSANQRIGFVLHGNSCFYISLMFIPPYSLFFLFQIHVKKILVVLDPPCIFLTFSISLSLFHIYLCSFGCVRSWLQHAGSFVVACRLFIAVWGLPSSCGTGRPRSWGTRASLSCDMWDLSSPTRNQTQVPCIGRWILNHWTTREIPLPVFEIPCFYRFLNLVLLVIDVVFRCVFSLHYVIHFLYWIFF